MAYLPLSTANLPDPVIDPAQGASPEDHFNTVTYDGLYETLGSNQLVTGVGFQPDFTWIKCRNLATNHILVDVLRYQSNTDNNMLYSNSTTAELDEDDKFRGFDTDGFNVGFYNDTGNIAGSYVAWNWKANGSGVSNTDGSITSTVSANTTSGTSIITWTGNATLSATIGHGLLSSPEMIIVKNRSVANSWIVQHHSVTGYLTLNGTGAVAGSNVFTPSSTTIQFDSTWDAINGNGNNMLCYCFHSVEGFSKLGSYVGNGSADGPFVYTGFRPSWLMVKKTDGAGVDGWTITDKERDPINVMDQRIQAQSSSAEAGDVDLVDFLSNGFKIRYNGQMNNQSGTTYIYMAFAENPFKYSNAR